MMDAPSPMIRRPRGSFEASPSCDAFSSYSSSCCCMCDVDMASVDAAKKEYRLADPARRVQLDALNQLAQGTASEEAGTSYVYLQYVLCGQSAVFIFNSYR